MADEFEPLGQLSFLIVDDFSNFTSALRAMVQSFGVSDIDTAANGEDTIGALQRKKYDVILSDYNLGDGKNGNDVLEEAKVQGLLKSSALYIMITAENASDMVRGALEYQPDDYLTKPITKEVLMTRLTRLRARNRVFTDVSRARDRKELERAASLIPDIIEEHNRYKRYGQRLQTELLMEAGQYQQANVLYQQVLREKPLAWATLGLGKSFYFQDDFDRAERFFQNLLDQNRGYVQAWDWLAKCQQARGDLEGAKESLAEAVSISPMNVRRQVALGDLAAETGDDERAERAYSRAVKVGKHSVFRSPENYMKMADMLVKRLDGAEGLNAKRFENKALDAMDELRQLYRGDNSVALKSRFVEHKVHTTLGRESEAEKALYRAYDICKNDTEGTLPGELKEELIGELEQLDKGDMVNTIVTAMQQEDSGYNNQAISAYEQGDLDAALDILKQAVQEKPRSYSICLNMAQVAIHHMIKNGITDENMELAGSALDRAASLNENDRRYANYLNLRKRYAQLEQRRKKES